MCHTCLGAPRPGTGVLSEKQLFLGVPEKGVLPACTEHHRGLSGEGMRGSRKGGEQELEGWGPARLGVS